MKSFPPPTPIMRSMPPLCHCRCPASFCCLLPSTTIKHGDGEEESGLEMDVFPGEQQLRSGGECVVCGRVVLCVPTSAR
jgi:hypothetical protein